MAIPMFTRRGRYVASAAAAALALGGAGAAVGWHESAGKTHARTDAAYCGLVACAVLNSGGPATATPATPLDSVPATGQPAGGGQVRARTSPTPAASASSAAPVTVPAVTPTPVPAPGPSPTPPSAPTPTPPLGPSPTPPSAAVTVSYSVLRQWHGGFLAELTIVNQGGPAVTGWQIVITLPGDQVQAVWNANWQQAGWAA